MRVSVVALMVSLAFGCSGGGSGTGGGAGQTGGGTSATGGVTSAGVELTSDDEAVPAGTFYAWVQSYNDAKSILRYQLDLSIQ
jgi:hypothetical protein